MPNKSKQPKQPLASGDEVILTKFADPGGKLSSGDEVTLTRAPAEFHTTSLAHQAAELEHATLVSSTQEGMHMAKADKLPDPAPHQVAPPHGPVPHPQPAHSQPHSPGAVSTAHGPATPMPGTVAPPAHTAPLTVPPLPAGPAGVAPAPVKPLHAGNPLTHPEGEDDLAAGDEQEVLPQLPEGQVAQPSGSRNPVRGQTQRHIDHSQESNLPEEPATAEQKASEQR